ELAYLKRLFPEANSLIFHKRLESVSFENIIDFLEEKIENADKLDDWETIERIRLEFKDIQFENLFKTALKYHKRISNLKRSFRHNFYTKYLDHIYSRDSNLAHFNSGKFSRTLEDFKKLDKKHIRNNRNRIMHELDEIKPQHTWVSGESSAVNILRKETIKKRRIKPIRKLFSEIPSLIETLKPCFLMSPLSVSKYLDPKKYHFDIVLFDEASQVRPEDALGAIMRADQAIVVGDRKQLPPTSFFKSFAEVADDEDYDIVDFESILDKFSTSGYPELMLKFHYRSRDESLIAFSNYHFYDNKLVTFPGTSLEKKNIGISLDYLEDGIYDRGKSRTNRKEARHIAKLALNHYKHKENFSLGIVAFSQSQQDAILEEIENVIRENPDYEHCFQGDGLEPFFVKNLENVQGDERDIMIFSIGYGKDIEGKLYMNFGPLNRKGGERRLNVAITRARYAVKIVVSFRSEELDTSRTKSQGVKLLKQYLKYAEHGGNLQYLKEKTSHSTMSFDSPFEKEVYNALTDLGYEVHTQVGTSNYRIDLGVIHPRFPGAYILGIECDGSTYHSSFTARDRDRIRQQFLESLGWKIHRVWSRDWVIKPKKEIQKIDKLIKKLEDKDPHVFKKNDTKKSRRKNNRKQPEEIKIEGDLRQSKSVSYSDLPPDIQRYNKYRKKYPKRYIYNVPKLSGVISSIVDKESPIHKKILEERLRECLKITRLGKKMQRKIDRAIYSLKGNAINYDGRKKILVKKSQLKIPVRYQKTNRRKIIEIPKLEIYQAICYILRDAVSLKKGELIQFTGKIFGYSSVHGSSKRHISDALSDIINTKYVIHKKGKYWLQDRKEFVISPRYV
ncbi:MAG: DUF3320 domain-containing protein, partial [Promethearchaeia archaeon]